MTIIIAICRVLGISRAGKSAAGLIAEDIHDPYADEPCIINGRDITYRQFNDELAAVYACKREASVPSDLVELHVAHIGISR
ncbi:hypothetical protein [Paracoccus sp. T5]|uniref:hypothetical protein n=1 Tax=Paracoccus sp. T5 TaxID=3402161 RepID=UPI003AEABEFB